MSSSSLWLTARLAIKILKTANRDIFNTPGVLDVVNEVARDYGGGAFSDDEKTINPGFKTAGRGFDITENGGYPTVWVECPNGYSFKVALDSSIDAALAENIKNIPF